MICIKCNIDQPEDCFYKGITHNKRDTTCKKCRCIGSREWAINNHEKKLEIEKKWIREHPERVKEIKTKYRLNNKDKARDYYLSNKEEHTEKCRERTQKLRREMIEAYGGICSCCGENRFEFLTLEHKNCDGADHRRNKGLYTIVRELKLAGWPQENYTILCWNCNSSKYMYGVCPHDLERDKV